MQYITPCIPNSFLKDVTVIHAGVATDPAARAAGRLLPARLLSGSEVMGVVFTS